MSGGLPVLEKEALFRTESQRKRNNLITQKYQQMAKEHKIAEEETHKASPFA